MKMLKKLLAVVLTGAMALTLFTACGSNAVTEKDIADAMTDIIKAEVQNQGKGTYITFTPRAQEREMARKIAALVESGSNSTELNAKVGEILEVDEGGANADNFVWVGPVMVDKIGVSGQAFQLIYILNDETCNKNRENLKNKEPADERHMGAVLCKMHYNGELVTARIVVITAGVDDKG